MSIEDRWQEPDAEYFKVRTADGKTYPLRYDQDEGDWTLRSGFDGDELLDRLGIEVVTVAASKIGEAEEKIAGYEHCHSNGIVKLSSLMRLSASTSGAKLLIPGSSTH